MTYLHNTVELMARAAEQLPRTKRTIHDVIDLLEMKAEEHKGTHAEKCFRAEAEAIREKYGHRIRTTLLSPEATNHERA